MNIEISRVLLGVLLAGASCARNAPPSQDEVYPSPAVQADTCPRSLPFRPTVLPPEFDPHAYPGAGGGAELPERSIAFHLRGPYDAEVGAYPIHINVFRGEAMYGVHDPDASPITVLGTRGRIGNIHEGYGVEFALSSERVGCQDFTLNAFGVTEQDLRKFAEGLEET